MELSLKEKSKRIKEAAFCLGFDAVGITQATHIGDAETHLQEWLDNGYHAEMGYMQNHFEKRCNPTLLVENAKSIVVLALNYFPNEKQPLQNPQIAYYAYSKDYHDIIREKLNQLFEKIDHEISPIQGRGFVDSAPVLERHWAQQAGIGWIGKNNLLIIPHKGSFYFLAELIIDIELEYDQPIKNRCGSCTRCQISCPTDALKPYSLDSNKCLSYLTIEKKGETPSPFPFKSHNRLFGCDLCQLCCPWNRFAEANNTAEFAPNEEILHLTSDEWLLMDEISFKKLVRSSPLKRTKQIGIHRNLI